MANRTKATEYAPLVVAAASRYGLAPALLAGLVDHETGGTWNPRAIRQEVRINDASRGLGQILYRTAQGMGYRGTPDGLFDPATNLDLAARYLDAQIRRAGGNIQGGLSAYNGGWRPADGFGQPSAREYTAVLARYQDGPKAGEPSMTRLVRPGEFANQPYVESIMGRAREFATLAALTPGKTAAAAASSAPKPAPLLAVLSPEPKPAPVAGKVPEAATVAKWAAGAVGAGLLYWLARKVLS